MSKLLGIDYGEKRIGLAIADGESKAVAPFKILENKKNFFSELGKIIDQENIDLIVVGLPVGLKNQETRQTITVREFTEKLKKVITLPIVFEDERLTSKIYQKSGKKYLDALSAMKILESYINRH